MPGILVIGYGNPLRGDDGFGRLAATFLADRHLPGVEVIVSHQLNPEVAASLSEKNFAIFLDAIAGDEPGRLSATPVEQCDISASGVSHHFEPGALLALSKAIYGKAPAAALITATARSFHHGTEVSEEVRQAAVITAEVIASLAGSDQLACETLHSALRKQTLPT